MEFAEGGGLDGRLAHDPLPPAEAARLVRTLAEAVHYAHGQGVVHRDLKPANVVLTAGEVYKLTDFGLARRLDASSGPTADGAIVGTLPYMPPEQAAGRAHDVGPHSDVYSLGAVFYELLTGRPPFRGRTVIELGHQVQTRRPLRPSRLARGIPAALASVCLKCLEKNPRRRYRSAAEVADDLGRWLGGRQPRGHAPAARVGRLLRWHPVRCIAAALLVLASVSAPLTAYFTDPERQRERLERRLAADEEETLVGATGKPLFGFAWATDEPSQKDRSGTEGAFCIESQRFAMAEFVRDPQGSDFCFSAQMHHDQVFGGNSHMGLYFACGQQGFCTVTLNGLSDVRWYFPRLKGNKVAVRTRLWGQPGHVADGGTDAGYLVLRVGGDAVGEWIDLAVDVSPEGIVLTVGVKDQPGEFVRRVSRAEVEDAWGAMGSPPGGGPKFEPRGSLGVYVYYGAASIRNVVVTPRRARTWSAPLKAGE